MRQPMRWLEQSPSTRRRDGARLASTLLSALLLACARASDVGDARFSTEATTGTELIEALERGDNHILIRNHMDLTPLQGISFFGHVGTPARSIRGDCDPVPVLPGLDPGAQPPRLRPRQCFLLVAGRFLNWGGGSPQVWIHNIYVQLKPRTEPSDVKLIDWIPFDSAARLWVTSTTLEGDAMPPGNASSCIGISTKSSPVYMRDCTFRRTCLSAVRAGYATTLATCAFIDNVSVDTAVGFERVPSAGVVHAYGPNPDPFKKLGVKMSQATFSNSTGAELGVDNAAVAYTDTPQPAISFNPRGGGRVRPLSEASGFLNGDEPGLLAIQQELGLAAPPQEMGSSSPAAAIAGGVVAAMAVIAIALVILVCWRRRRRRRRETEASAVERKSSGAKYDSREIAAVHTARMSGNVGSIYTASDGSQAVSALGVHTNSTGGHDTAPSDAEQPRSAASLLRMPPRDDAQQSGQGTPSRIGPGSVVSGSTGRTGTSTQSAPVYTGIVDSSVNTLSTVGGSRKAAATVAQRTQHGQLITALDNLVFSEPPRLFADRYLLLNERVSGGQAVVQFARGRDGGFMQYAVKFCHNKDDFDLEVRLYEHPLIRETLPMLLHSCDNADGRLKSRSGFVFPPHLVLERGVSLSDWRRTKRGFHMVLHMFHDLAQCLEIVHRAGRVHRDLKPGNSLLMLHSQCWRLLDFGIAAEIGESVAPRCTLAYAAPEVLAAYAAKQRVPADPGHDVWALGVMVYECLTHSTAFPVYMQPSTVFQVAAGDAQYPWEQATKDASFQKSKARPVLEACLSRDPRRRPTAKQLVKMIDALGNNATVDVKP